MAEFRFGHLLACFVNTSRLPEKPKTQNDAKCQNRQTNEKQVENGNETQFKNQQHVSKCV